MEKVFYKMRERERIEARSRDRVREHMLAPPPHRWDIECRKPLHK